MSDVPEEFDGKYVTEAVESGVRGDDRELLGHVALLDLDGASLEAAIENARRLEGIVAVLESSPGSYHVWSLSIRPLEEQLEIARELPAVDPEHVDLSRRRECAVLRVDEKVGVGTGDVVKPAPRVEKTLEDVCPEVPQSAPHLELLEELGAEIVRPHGYETVGMGVDRRVYMARIGGRGGDRR